MLRYQWRPPKQAFFNVQFVLKNTLWIKTMHHEYNQQLFVTDKRFIDNWKILHKVVTNSKISGYCKTIIRKTGIDNGKYLSASTRKAKIEKLLLCEMNEAVCWTDTSTLKRFYNKPLCKPFRLICSMIIFSTEYSIKTS